LHMHPATNWTIQDTIRRREVAPPSPSGAPSLDGVKSTIHAMKGARPRVSVDSPTWGLCSEAKILAYNVRGNVVLRDLSLVQDGFEYFSVRPLYAESGCHSSKQIAITVVHTAALTGRHTPESGPTGRVCAGWGGARALGDTSSV
jgi:hypothetical protein